MKEAFDAERKNSASSNIYNNVDITELRKFIEKEINESDDPELKT